MKIFNEKELFLIPRSLRGEANNTRGGGGLVEWERAVSGTEHINSTFIILNIL
jgi:hypothetical protein